MAKRIGDYTLIEKLGGGAEAVIWKAQSSKSVGGLSAGSIVALKCLRQETTDSRYRKLERSFTKLQEINHPNVVRYYEMFVHSDDFEDRPVIAMEFVEGQQLTQWIEGHKFGGCWENVKPIVYQCLSALDATSAVNLIHRDVKPSNILITPDLRVKLIDFEIARVAEGSATKTVGAVGTCDYMAPEFARSEANFRGSVQSDIFSLTVCLYHMLTGDLPFPPIEGDLHEFHRRWTEAKTDLPVSFKHDNFKILSHSQALVKAGLTMDPGRRFKDHRSMEQAVERVTYRKVVHGEKEYELRALIGRGGFGRVYRAVRVSDGAPVAVKYLMSAKYEARFRREARALRRSRRIPGMVGYVDFFKYEETESYFLVMELLPDMPGSTLLDRLREDVGKHGLSHDLVLRHFVSYLLALHHLHKNGIIHRDLKPANLYFPVGGNRTACLMDLGIARDASGTKTHGGLPGTLEYMPPEFASANTPERGASTSDLYSLGLCFYEGLCNRRALPPLKTYHSDVHRAFFVRATKRVDVDFTHPAFKEFPATIRVLQKLTAQNPRRRYQAASEAIRDLAKAYPEVKKYVEEFRKKYDRRHKRRAEPEPDTTVEVKEEGATKTAMAPPVVEWPAPVAAAADDDIPITEDEVIAPAPAAIDETEIVDEVAMPAAAPEAAPAPASAVKSETSRRVDTAVFRELSESRAKRAKRTFQELKRPIMVGLSVAAGVLLLAGGALWFTVLKPIQVRDTIDAALDESHAATARDAAVLSSLCASAVTWSGRDVMNNKEAWASISSNLVGRVETTLGLFEDKFKAVQTRSESSQNAFEKEWSTARASLIKIPYAVAPTDRLNTKIEVYFQGIAAGREVNTFKDRYAGLQRQIENADAWSLPTSGYVAQLLALNKEALERAKANSLIAPGGTPVGSVDAREALRGKVDELVSQAKRKSEGQLAKLASAQTVDATRMELSWMPTVSGFAADPGLAALRISAGITDMTAELDAAQNGVRRAIELRGAVAAGGITNAQGWASASSAADFLATNEVRTLFPTGVVVEAVASLEKALGAWSSRQDRELTAWLGVGNREARKNIKPIGTLEYQLDECKKKGGHLYATYFGRDIDVRLARIDAGLPEFDRKVVGVRQAVIQATEYAQRVDADPAVIKGSIDALLDRVPGLTELGGHDPAETDELGKQVRTLAADYAEDRLKVLELVKANDYSPKTRDDITALKRDVAEWQQRDVLKSVGSLSAFRTLAQDLVAKQVRADTLLQKVTTALSTMGEARSITMGAIARLQGIAEEELEKSLVECVTSATEELKKIAAISIPNDKKSSFTDTRAGFLDRVRDSVSKHETWRAERGANVKALDGLLARLDRDDDRTKNLNILVSQARDGCVVQAENTSPRTVTFVTGSGTRVPAPPGEKVRIGFVNVRDNPTVKVETDLPNAYEALPASFDLASGVYVTNLVVGGVKKTPFEVVLTPAARFAGLDAFVCDLQGQALDELDPVAEKESIQVQIGQWVGMKRAKFKPKYVEIDDEKARQGQVQIPPDETWEKSNISKKLDEFNNLDWANNYAAIAQRMGELNALCKDPDVATEAASLKRTVDNYLSALEDVKKSTDAVKPDLVPFMLTKLKREKYLLDAAFMKDFVAGLEAHVEKVSALRSDERVPHTQALRNWFIGKLPNEGGSWIGDDTWLESEEGAYKALKPVSADIGDITSHAWVAFNVTDEVNGIWCDWKLADGTPTRVEGQGFATPIKRALDEQTTISFYFEAPGYFPEQQELTIGPGYYETVTQRSLVTKPVSVALTYAWPRPGETPAATLTFARLDDDGSHTQNTPTNKVSLKPGDWRVVASRPDHQSVTVDKFSVAINASDAGVSIDTPQPTSQLVLLTDAESHVGKNDTNALDRLLDAAAPSPLDFADHKQRWSTLIRTSTERHMQRLKASNRSMEKIIASRGREKQFRDPTVYEPVPIGKPPKLNLKVVPPPRMLLAAQSSEARALGVENEKYRSNADLANGAAATEAPLDRYFQRWKQSLSVTDPRQIDDAAFYESVLGEGNVYDLGLALCSVCNEFQESILYYDMVQHSDMPKCVPTQYASRIIEKATGKSGLADIVSQYKDRVTAGWVLLMLEEDGLARKAFPAGFPFDDGSALVTEWKGLMSEHKDTLMNASKYENFVFYSKLSSRSKRSKCAASARKCLESAKTYYENERQPLSQGSHVRAFKF